MTDRRPLGILAGAGALPVLAARLVARAGRPVFGVQLAEAGQRGLAAHCAAVITPNLGQVGRILDFWREAGVREVLFIGKVDKTLHFEALEFDEVGKEMLSHLVNRQDGSLFGLIADEMEARGFTVAPQTEVLAALLARPGHLAGPPPTPSMLRDIQVGQEIAAVVSGYEVGQTVAVKLGAVVAIEAFEHTDAALRRAGKLAGRGWVAVKAARPKQDPRFDVPTVGLRTLSVLHRAGGCCLAVEAGQVFVVDEKRVLRFAEANGITLFGASRSH
jgi:hypothetical protein